MSEFWKILLIEDDEDDYLLTSAMLTRVKHGQFLLDWVSNYEAALERFRVECYDIFLVDYRLGEHTGLDVVRVASSSGCQGPFIFLTGEDNYSIDLEAMAAGATDYLVKSEVTAGMLERVIRYAIGTRRAEEALRESERQLLAAHADLERRVQERTQELAKANAILEDEIEERRRIEAALRASEIRFRTLTETTSSAIFILNGMTIQYANTAARWITGYTPEELAGREFWELAHPLYQSALRQGGLVQSWTDWSGDQFIPSRYELKILTRSGKERWIDVTAGRMQLEGQDAVIITAFDITERDLAEETLKKIKADLETRVSDYAAKLEATQKELDRHRLQLHGDI